jgi:hypothetical protein
MLAAQLLASHNASMECYRRAMIPEQSFEGRKENLNQANKLSRTHVTLLEALNRHRGKGNRRSPSNTSTSTHGGPSPGAPKGNRNAFKHGRYTAEAIGRRREIAALLRIAREL